MALAAALAGCHTFGRATTPGGGGKSSSYAVLDALAVGNGGQATGGALSTTYYAPAPTGSPTPAAQLSGAGQITYAPDGTLYRYTNGTSGCAIAKFPFGAVNATQPVATATGDPHLGGSGTNRGCLSSATDPTGSLYVLVANANYLGVDVFDTNLVYQRQIGNGARSGIVARQVSPALPLAIDTTGLLYVGEPGGIVTFAAGASGDASPVGSLPVNSLSLALDASDNLYVGNAADVSVYAAGTNVAASTLLLPTNLTSAGASPRITGPNSLALDSAGNLYVLATSVAGAQTQALLYASGAVGNALPLATIQVGSSAGSLAVAPPGAPAGAGL